MTTIVETGVAGEIADELSRSGPGGRLRVGRTIIGSADYYRRAPSLAGFVKMWPDVDRLLAANGGRPDAEGFVREARRILGQAAGVTDPPPDDQRLGPMHRLLWRSWYATVLANDPSTDREELASWLRFMHLASLRERPQLERALAHVSMLRPAVPIRFLSETKRIQPPTKTPRTNRLALDTEIADLTRLYAKLGALYAERLQPRTKAIGAPAPQPAPRKARSSKRSSKRAPVVMQPAEPEPLEVPWSLSPAAIQKDRELRELLARHGMDQATNIFQTQQAILSRIAKLESRRASFPATSRNVSSISSLKLEEP